MKKLLLVAVIISSLLTSCGYKSEVRPLKDGFSTFTAKDEKTGEILIGLLESNYNKVIIPADKYTDFDVDKNLILCTKNEGIYAYTRDGKAISPLCFKTFNSIELGTYYTATHADDRYIYYPETKLLVQINNSLIVGGHLITDLGDGKWGVFDIKGNKTFEFNDNSIILHSLKQGTNDDYVIAVPVKKSKNTTYDIYKLSGEKKFVYPSYVWKKIEKKFKNTKTYGNLKVTDVNV